MPEKKVEDNRQMVPLTDPEIAIVALEMRQMRASVQGMPEGLARGDYQAVVEVVAKSGMAMMPEVPSPIRMKLPPPFAQRGAASLQVFDQTAREAKPATGPGPTLKQLSETY